MEIHYNEKGERIGSSPLWACRQCGGTFWYMALHDDLCPGLAKYASEEELQASRERYR
jgi:rubrerythrin